MPLLQLFWGHLDLNALDLLLAAYRLAIISCPKVVIDVVVVIELAYLLRRVISECRIVVNLLSLVRLVSLRKELVLWVEGPMTLCHELIYLLSQDRLCVSLKVALIIILKYPRVLAQVVLQRVVFVVLIFNAKRDVL